MKIPWDKNYLKISFHVIITILFIYIAGLLIRNIFEVKVFVFDVVSNLLSVLTPLLVALIFSYITDPAVDFFQRLADKVIVPKPTEGFKTRKKGTTLTYVTIVVSLWLIIRFLAMKIGSSDITSIANSLNESIQGFSDLIVLFYVKLENWGILQNVDGSATQDWISSVTQTVTNYIMGFATSFTRMGGLLLNAFIGLTAAFYLLVEKEKILYYSNTILDVCLNEKHAKKVKGILSDMNNIFSGYIGGQITDALIMAVLISISLSLAGIKYPGIIGAISGFSNLIPYVGAIVAFILSVAVGLFSGTPIKALYAAIIVLTLQQVDGMFIVPKVVGKSVELHPVLVLLSLSIFGSLFGLLGMIVAVPVTALIRLFLSRWYHKKREAQT